jgi:hypothetical protein
MLSHGRIAAFLASWEESIRLRDDRGQNGNCISPRDAVEREKAFVSVTLADSYVRCVK